ncbi:DegT/DnrJ/EryC1/StrS family aminotransferase [Croceibacter atlanticus]|uniref:DegT/DnrJ/EryC1/StrS family aminotransferase n=1 Tax=Croceibacter atlanticus TaxID=313588 RepID=UPI0024BAAE12|nr:DegT/DnrJ/EryC1/StrS family aminotransferase [Croceibacter atlanticus]
MIPFLNLRQLNSKYDTAFKNAYRDVLDSGYYILGKQVSLFEHNYASYCQAEHCIGTGNGLDALTLILKGYMSLGKLSKGDEVIVASNTYIATILAVKLAGLTPVLVEPDINTYNLDSRLIKNSLTRNTKVVLMTHLYGQLCDVNAIRSICDNNQLLLIDDCAQSHGARLNSKLISGNLCDASAHSFYPTKNLGALGDAGAVTTNDNTLAERIKSLRNYGFNERYVADYEGVNSRLDDVQASILNIKLKFLDEDNASRQHIAKRYVTEIQNEAIILPLYDNSQCHVFHLFVVRVANRTAFSTYLKNNAIGYNIHYPVAPHKQQALQELSKLSFPISEKIHDEVISLPCHPMLTDTEVSTIINVVNAYK